MTLNDLRLESRVGFWSPANKKTSQHRMVGTGVDTYASAFAGLLLRNLFKIPEEP